MEMQETQQSVWKMNEVEGLVCNIKTLYKTVIKIVLYWFKAGIQYINRKELSPEISTFYEQLIFNKSTKKLSGENILFKEDGAGATGHPHKNEVRGPD